MTTITERTTITLLIIPLIFLAINFDYQFGIIFGIITLSNSILYTLDSRVTFNIEKPGNKKLTTVLWALGGFFAFTILSQPIVNFLAPYFGYKPVEGINSVIELFSQYIPYFSQITPILGNNLLLTVLGFGMLVPIVESIFFNVRVYEAFTDLFKVNTSTFNPKHILVAFGLIPGLATAFHFSVRGIDVAATPGLLLTFIFFGIGQWLVIMRKQGLEAVVMHTVANLTAITLKVGFIALQPWLIPILYFAGFLFILKTKPVQKILQSRLGG